MKIARQEKPDIIVGKRVAVGAAINSTAAVFAAIYPDEAPAIVASAVPITFAVQTFIANFWGVTSAE
jgi:hypothetical protein